jgi:hypothetical protein
LRRARSADGLRPEGQAERRNARGGKKTLEQDGTGCHGHVHFAISVKVSSDKSSQPTVRREIGVTLERAIAVPEEN